MKYAAIILSHLLISLSLLGQVPVKAVNSLREPYRPLHGGSFVGEPVKASPDPLLNYRWKKLRASDSLQLYIRQPVSLSGTGTRKSSSPGTSFFKADGKNGIIVMGTGDIMIDFGVESAGWLEFESTDLVGSVSGSISEYNEPAILNEGAQNPVKTKGFSKYGNRYRLELNDQLYEGVRFAWIHLRTVTKVFHIKNLRLVCQVKPVNYVGSFHSNDTLLNRIWYTGAYVVKLNMLQEYFGAILMERSDRHSWTGDAYPAQAAAMAAFGSYDEVAKNIAFTSVQDNGIPAYSIYWVLSLVEYFQYTGDVAFLKRFIPNANQRLQLAIKQFDSLPALSFMGWDERLGAGFEHPDIAESQAAFRLLCINAWKKFSMALNYTGDILQSQRYAGFAEQKLKQLAADPAFASSLGVHAIAEAINAGLEKPLQLEARAQQQFTDRLNRLSYSPFNQYFILQAMGLSGNYTEALQTIHDAWGGQVNYGGTCLFEVFRPSWNSVLAKNDAPPNNQCGYTSLAHPWGAGVTKWISENILGIVPVLPGFKIFDVIPHLNGNLTKVKGSMPVPSGSISVEFDAEAGIFSIVIPAGTHAREVGVPKLNRSVSAISINNKEWHGGKREDSEFVYLRDLKAGSYKIRINYSNPVLKMRVPVPDFEYPVSGFIQDSLTRGDWMGRYGGDGYLIFGGAHDLMGELDSLQVKLGELVHWDKSLLDTSVKGSLLQSPDRSPAVAAAMVTQDPKPTLQTFTIDIYSKPGDKKRISLYFLDADKQSRRSAIEIFDLVTLGIISPVGVVSHYETGRYLSFVADRPVRIRVNHVRGKNATLAGIFLDHIKK